MKLPLIISSCLLGNNTKYNGKNNESDKKRRKKGNRGKKEFFDFIVICPEVEGGLSIPRDPAEIIGNKVITNNGKDVTKNYNNGAKHALDKALKYKAKYALLKAKSPSCGKDYIYDGTFSGNLIKGDGVTVSILKKNGIKVFTENEIELLLKEISTNITK